MAKYEVYLTEDAEADLEGIAEYIEFHDSAERADTVFEMLKESVLKLESLPGRRRVVPELREVGVTEYREIVNKPFRILYFVSGRKVIVHGISTVAAESRSCSVAEYYAKDRSVKSSSEFTRAYPCCGHPRRATRSRQNTGYC